MTKARYFGQIDTSANNKTRLVTLDDLKLNPQNEREYNALSEDNVALRQSILAAGLQKPIEVYEDGIVHDGNRRVFNLMWMRENEGFDPGLIRITFVERPENEVDAVKRRLNTNEARQFNLYEKGKAFAVMRTAGMNNSEIARETPFTSALVGQALWLFDNITPEVAALISEGKVAATLAADVLKEHGAEDGLDVLECAIAMAEAEGKTKATQRHVDHVTRKDEVPSEPLPSVSEVLGTTGAEEVEVGGSDDDLPFDLDDNQGDLGGDDVESTEEVDVGGDAGDDTEEVEVGGDGDAGDEGDTEEVEVGGAQVTQGTPKFSAAVAKAMLEQFLPFAERVLSKRGKRDFKAEAEAFMDTLEALVEECRVYNIEASKVDAD